MLFGYPKADVNDVLVSTHYERAWGGTRGSEISSPHTDENKAARSYRSFGAKKSSPFSSYTLNDCDGMLINVAH